MPDLDVIPVSLAILALPLVAFAVQMAGGRWLPLRGGWVPTLVAMVAWVAAVALFATRVLGSGGSLGARVFSRPWLALGPVVMPFSVLVDNLTLTMLFIVTTVSALVHLYSTAYMRDDPRAERYFAHLSFFTFSMLLLVLASNLLLLYVAWELVGVSSYLLIGFHLERPAAARASMKAFIVNRVGDAGFFAGILVVFAALAPRLQPGASPFEFGTIFASIVAGQWDPHTLTAAALLLFVGAAAKSAQFPLHVWLPDAMEGPTPVSALIHAATMVAAGVYMVARLYPIFAGADALGSHALWVVAGVGAVTALLGASVALVQTDLKRGLAYSTVSQLGLMMLGLGVGGWSAALFHLFTHAFFKACLFLCAGSVIHAVHTNEMPLMGGLRRKMPTTYAAFLVSTCAIAGVPFLSGFWSKEAILRAAWVFGEARGGGLSALPFAVAALTSGLTAFYMLRLLVLTFEGEPRDRSRFEHAHESPALMTAPLVILAALAIGAGGLLPRYSGWFGQRLDPRAMEAGAILSGSSDGVRPEQARALLLHGGEGASARLAHETLEEEAHGPVLAASLLALLAGAGTALWLYVLGPHARAPAAPVAPDGSPLAPARAVLVNLYYVDRFYDAVFVRGLALLRGALAWIDANVVDRIVNIAGALGLVIAKVAGALDYWGVDAAVRGASAATARAGEEARRVQTGRVQEYLYLSLVLFGFIFLVWTVAGSIP